MPSENWNRFYESYFGDPYMAWHDGLDESALLSLTGEERDRAEQMLTDALDSSDHRPAAGLAALRSPEAATSLKAALSGASGTAKVQTALALWRIEKYAPAVYALLSVLKEGAHWSIRMDAARALGDVPVPPVIQALWEAVEKDPADLVRSHAATSLLDIYNIPRDDYNSHPLAIDIMSENPAKREQAVKELRDLVVRRGRLDG